MACTSGQPRVRWREARTDGSDASVTASHVSLFHACRTEPSYAADGELQLLSVSVSLFTDEPREGE